jgi:hypothetical protein
VISAREQVVGQRFDGFGAFVEKLPLELLPSPRSSSL